MAGMARLPLPPKARVIGQNGQWLVYYCGSIVAVKTWEKAFDVAYEAARDESFSPIYRVYYEENKDSQW